MDLIHAADTILNGALAFCLDPEPQEAQITLIEDLRSGNCAVIQRFKRGLAQQVAKHLGMCDDDVRAVYLYNHNVEATQADPEWYPPVVHLIVWAQPKTAALASLIAALNRALTRAYDDWMGDLLPIHLLDVQVVDDGEVMRRIGYAGLLFSPQVQPLAIWQREPVSECSHQGALPLR
jgi:hypothetical protein